MKDKELSRREAVGLAAGVALTLVAGERWVFAASDGQVVKAAADITAPWRPVLLDARQGEGLARLVDTLIPRTETPGARDARVHEYIDLAVSLETPEERKDFVSGFRWLDRRCRRLYDADLAEASEAQLVELLTSISDLHAEHPKSLQRGALFFADLKQRTIFGYYTSLQGRVQELGLPEAVTMQHWQGCRHPDGAHDT
jgi:hypothetical protein